MGNLCSIIINFHWSITNLIYNIGVYTTIKGLHTLNETNYGTQTVNPMVEYIMYFNKHDINELHGKMPHNYVHYGHSNISFNPRTP